MLRHRFRFTAPLAGAGVLLLIAAGPVAAHVVKQVGAYTLEIGWQREPTYTGETNGVSVTVRNSAGNGVTDLGPTDLQVVVSTGDQQSPSLTFEPAFDLEEEIGTAGEYDAAILPTTPGEYAFHITGSIHGTAVDLNLTSSETTFDAVRSTTDIEFPNKLPAMSDVVTRLDRIDARLGTGTTLPTLAAVEAASAAASNAQSAADRALLVGGGIGAVGLIVGVLGLLVAIRVWRSAHRA